MSAPFPADPATYSGLIDYNTILPSIDILDFIEYNGFTRSVKRVNFMKQRLTELQYVQLAKERFSSLFTEIPFVSDIEIINTGFKSDFGDFRAIVYFSDDDSAQDFIVEVKSNGEKRFANLFRMEALQHHDNICHMLIAPFISEASSKLLRDNKLSFLDLCGNCYVLTRRMVIQISGKPNHYIDRREKRNYFSKTASAASAIMRTMLDDPDKMWKVKELSEATGKALGSVSNVKAFLRDRDWLEEQGQSFRIKNTRELLREWSRDYLKRDSIVKEYYSLDSVPVLEDSISRWSLAHDQDAVLAGFSAAARYTPTVRYNRINVYVKEQSLYEFVKDLELEPVQAGGNVIVTIPHDDTPCMFFRTINLSPVSSPVQTVIDLYGMPNRGEEAADAIINKIYNR